MSASIIRPGQLLRRVQVRDRQAVVTEVDLTPPPPPVRSPLHRPQSTIRSSFAS